MNIPTDSEALTLDIMPVRAYKTGHRDARHAAAEIANEADAEVARLTAERDGLAKALRNLVKMNVEHNEAVEAVIGRPVNWSDNYLDEARAALAALPIPARESLAELKDAYLEGYEQHSVDSVYQNSPPNAEEAWETSDTKRFAAPPKEADSA